MVTFAEADWRTVNTEMAAREIQKARMYLIIAQKINTWHLILVINTLGLECIYIKHTEKGQNAESQYRDTYDSR